MTLKLFLTDTLKNLILSTTIYNIFMIILEGIISIFGNNFFVFLWIAFLIIMLVLLTIYPLYIAPLFNKFEALNLDNPKEK